MKFSGNMVDAFDSATIQPSNAGVAFSAQLTESFQCLLVANSCWRSIPLAVHSRARILPGWGTLLSN